MEKKDRKEARKKILDILQTATDYLLLGLLAFLCSLPVITLGASATAFYAAGLKMQNGEGGALYSMFFSTFRSSFKRSTLLWLPFFLLILLLFGNFVFYFYMAGNGAVWAQFGLGACFAVGLFLSLAGSFLFPLLAADETLRGIEAAKFSLYAAGKNLHWWLVKTALQLALLILIWFVPFLIVFAPGVLLYCNTRLIRRVLPTIFPEN